MQDQLTIEHARDLRLLQAISPEVVDVYLWNLKPEAVRLPLLPAHVTGLCLQNVTLVGPVAFSEGLIYLMLDLVESEVPIEEWQFPASLRTIEIRKSKFTTLDLSQTRLTELTLERQKTHNGRIVLPPSLLILGLNHCWFRKLPRIPASLKSLWLVDCSRVTDFSPASEVKIEDLSTDRSVPLYANFPELIGLTLTDVKGGFSEISLTHLRYLRFSDCVITEPVELNAPNLVEITFYNSDQVPIRGNFAESVAKISLRGHSSFPGDEDWASLTTLEIRNVERRPYGPEQGSAATVTEVELPCLPWLRRLAVAEPVLTNGVMISNLYEYKEAWGMTRRAKRPQYESEQEA